MIEISPGELFMAGPFKELYIKHTTPIKNLLRY